MSRELLSAEQNLMKTIIHATEGDEEDGVKTRKITEKQLSEALKRSQLRLILLRDNHFKLIIIPQIKYYESPGTNFSLHYLNMA